MSLFELPEEPTTPNTTEDILVVDEFHVFPGELVYATTLPLLIDHFSGFPTDAANYEFINEGTIWNQYTTESTILDVNLWRSFSNTGVIVSRATAGSANVVLAGGSFLRFSNTGQIFAWSDTQTANVITTYDSSGIFINSGLLAAYGYRGAVTVRAVNGGELVNSAFGEILAEGGASSSPLITMAIYFGRGHWEIPGYIADGVDLVNRGLIEARNDTTHDAIGLSINNLSSELFTIYNYGTIRADRALYSLEYAFSPPQNARQLVYNFAGGSIEGMIDIRLGNDIVYNYGSIVGTVAMGAGHDLVLNEGSIVGDILLGAGNDVLVDRSNGSGSRDGGDGNDLLWGFGTLSGGQGDDVLIARQGAILIGGAGADRFLVGDPSVTSVTIADFQSGVDTIDLSWLAPTQVTVSGNIVTAVHNGGTVTITVNGTVSASDVHWGSSSQYSGTAGDDALTAGSGGSTLSGGDGADLLVGGDGDDILNGGSGSDQMFGGAGDDTYYVNVRVDDFNGDVGDSVVELADGGTDTVLATCSYTLTDWVERLVLVEGYIIDGGGNALDNQITGNNQHNALNGGAGNDWLLGEGSSDTLNGGEGDDRLDGGTGDDYLYGDDGDDVLDGNSGADQLFGGEGNDTLSGSEGIDTLTGGSGADTFKDTASGLNGDTITDFAVGDKIVITDAELGGFSFSLSGSTLTYTGGSLTLAGFSGTLTAAAAAGGGVQLTVTSAVARNDFNGDGRSDILWRNDNGTLSDWLGAGNGGFVANDANAAAFVSTDWSVTGIGDFDGDGRSDILWRNQNGILSNWLGTTNGGFIANDANAVSYVPLDWRVAAVGDFNGDGRSDILWRNDNGVLSDWLGASNGGFTANDTNAVSYAPLDWSVVAVGDFNGDGRSDILWRSDAGLLSDWLGTAEGGFVNNDVNALAGVPTEWQVIGVGDFNGDGRDDIIWRNVDGTLSNWLGNSNGGFTPNANGYAIVPLDWGVAAIGDFNGDGRDDILWRNDNGTVSDWLADANGGFTSNDVHAASFAPTDWHIQALDIHYV